MSPDIAWITLLILLGLAWGGIIFWLIYISIKKLSPYTFCKENRYFCVYLMVIMGGMIAIYDFTPADSSDLKKIDQYLKQAQQEDNRDLLSTIQQIKAQPQISIKDRKYIEKLIDKGI